MLQEDKVLHYKKHGLPETAAAPSGSLIPADPHNLFSDTTSAVQKYTEPKIRRSNYRQST